MNPELDRRTSRELNDAVPQHEILGKYISLLIDMAMNFTFLCLVIWQRDSRILSFLLATLS